MNPAYEREPYLREIETEVISVGREGESGRAYAILAETIFYPEGGGQPADHGWLAEARVTDVQKLAAADGRPEVRHYLEGPLAPGAVRARLDWERRFDHMQHHTGQHLLSALAEDRCGWLTTSFHLGALRCDVELDTDTLRSADLEALESAVAAEIRAARTVAPRWVDPAEYAELPVRSRGLPEGHTGGVRLVEIDGVDLNTCGGTHLASTAEIESLHLLGWERLRGGARLFFVCGRRARRRMSAHEERASQLRRLLGAADDGIVAAVEQRLEEAKQMARRQKELATELAEAIARELAASPAPLIEAHFEHHDAAFLAQLAAQLAGSFAERTAGKLALLTAGGADGGAFVLLAGAGLDLDLRPLASDVAALLGGSGGGKGARFQGKAASFARRAEAVARLAAEV